MNEKILILGADRYIGWSLMIYLGVRNEGRVIGFIINKIPRIYQRLFCFIFPTEERYYELEVVKD